MREIKFRAWYEDEIVEITQLNLETTEHTVFDGTHEYICNVNEKDVMQYTVLKDKNGTEIYEGDILKYFGECREVIYRESSFGWMEDGNYYAFTEMAPSEIPKTEVIGNIYENPELLESKS